MKRILYEDKEWKIIEDEGALPDGKKTKRARVYRSDSVHILAFPKADTILLLREWRSFYGEWLWMIPSGRADKEKDIAIAAQRELQEETGFRARTMEHYFSTSHTESIVYTNHVFLGRDLEHAPLAKDHDECIEVHEVPLREAILDATKDCYKHTVTAYSLLRYGAEHGYFS
jgi:ADP-ribose pyrophosphatase